MKDIGDLCTSCHRSTAFGTGLFVNRSPSMSDTENGYMCPECLAMDCDRCGKPIPVDEDCSPDEGETRLHWECVTPEELKIMEEEI